jgi:hypothetical protein
MSVYALFGAVVVLAILVVPAMRRRSAAVVPVLVLAAFAAVCVFRTTQAAVHTVHAHGLPVRVAGLDPPPANFHNPSYANVAGKALGRIPAGATYAIVAAKHSPSVFWLRYILAPHREVDPGQAHWVIVVGERPQQAGVRPLRAWRAGDTWLVRT